MIKNIKKSNKIYQNLLLDNLKNLKIFKFILFIYLIIILKIKIFMIIKKSLLLTEIFSSKSDLLVFSKFLI